MVKKMLQTTHEQLQENDTAVSISSLSNLKSVAFSKMAKMVVERLVDDNNSEKLDNFLHEFTADLKEALSQVLVGADDEIANFIVQEVKVTLKIADDNPIEPFKTESKWPEIIVQNGGKLDKLAYQVNVKVRELTTKIFSKIMIVLPKVITKISNVFVESQVQDKVEKSKTGISFLDGVVEKVTTQTSGIQSKLATEFVEFLWEGIDDTVASELIANLVQVEDAIVKKFRDTASILPGI